MRIKPLLFAASAAMLISVGLSGCVFNSNDDDIVPASDLSLSTQAYGIAVDDTTGMIITVIGEGVKSEVDDVVPRPGTTYFVFEGKGSIHSVNLPLHGEVIIDGTSYVKGLHATYSLSSEQVVYYYNQIVGQGFTHEFEEGGASPADLVLYDIQDRLEMAEYDGIMPVVPLILDGTGASLQDQSIAASFSAGLTGDEAALLRQDVICQEQMDLQGFDESDQLSPNYCESANAPMAPGDGSIVTTITEYDFDCTTVGLKVNNWKDFASNLNSVIETTNVRFTMDNPGSLTLKTSLPCDLQTYTHVEAPDFGQNGDGSESDLHDSNDEVIYNGCTELCGYDD